MNLYSFSVGTVGGLLSMATMYTVFRTSMSNQFESMNLHLTLLEKQLQPDRLYEPTVVKLPKEPPSAQSSSKRMMSIWNDMILQIGHSLTGPY